MLAYALRHRRERLERRANPTAVYLPGKRGRAVRDQPRRGTAKDAGERLREEGNASEKLKQTVYLDGGEKVLQKSPRGLNQRNRMIAAGEKIGGIARAKRRYIGHEKGMTAVTQ